MEIEKKTYKINQFSKWNIHIYVLENNFKTPTRIDLEITLDQVFWYVSWIYIIYKA